MGVWNVDSRGKENLEEDRMGNGEQNHRIQPARCGAGGVGAESQRANCRIDAMTVNGNSTRQTHNGSNAQRTSYE